MLTKHSVKIKQKLLDKRIKKVYNLNKVEDVSDLLSFSPNEDVYDNIQNLKHLSLAIQKTKEVFHYEKDFPKIVIAGGAIRDLFFGLHPKDFDVFVDFSEYTKEEAEDLNLLIVHEIAKNYDVAIAPYEHKKEVKYEKETQKRGENFEIKSIYSFTPREHALIQIIGFTSPDKPLVDTFDYSLVKTWYDPQSYEVNFSNEFIKACYETDIVVTNKRTKNRVYNFIYRYEEWHDPFFKLVDKLPKVDVATKLETLYNTTTKSGNYRVVRHPHKVVINPIPVNERPLGEDPND